MLVSSTLSSQIQQPWTYQWHELRNGLKEGSLVSQAGWKFGKYFTFLHGKARGLEMTHFKVFQLNDLCVTIMYSSIVFYRKMKIIIIASQQCVAIQCFLWRWCSKISQIDLYYWMWRLSEVGSACKGLVCWQTKGLFCHLVVMNSDTGFQIFYYLLILM